MGKKVAVVVTNDLSTDQRVQRTIGVLRDMGFEVTFIGRELPTSMPFEPEYRTVRFKLSFTKGAAFYASFNWRLFKYLMASEFDLFLANDLDTLLAVGYASKYKQIPFIYDSHEFFTGVPEIQDRPFVMKTWKWIERKFYSAASARITVNRSIARLLESAYGGEEPHVVRNIGQRPPHVPEKTRRELGLPEDAFIFINQGSGINVDRGMEEAVQAIKKVDGATLLIVGGGDVIPMLKKQVADEQLGEKVIFVDKVPYADLLAYTKLANCGLSLDKPNSINYMYSLPNKLFDYIHSDLPVITSQVVEVKRIVDEYSIGITVNSADVNELANAMEQMKTRSKDQYSAGLARAKAELNWNQERKVLEEVFTPFLSEQK